MTAQKRALFAVERWTEREWDAKAAVEHFASVIRDAERAAYEKAAAECDAVLARREAQIATAGGDDTTRTILTSVALGAELCAVRVRALGKDKEAKR